MDLKTVNLKQWLSIKKQCMLYKRELKYSHYLELSFLPQNWTIYSLFFNVLANRHKGKSSVIKVIEIQQV